MNPPESGADTQTAPDVEARAGDTETAHPPPAPSLAVAATLAAIVVGMIAAAVYRQGAFYPLDAFGVAVVSLVLVAIVLARERDRVAVSAAVLVVGLAGWWLSRAVAERSAVDFLPLGASFLGFLAAFVVVRRLKGDDPSRVAGAVVAIGALSAAAGVAGVLGRFHPLAQQSDHYWQVATTLTYPAAAALLTIIALLVSLSLDLRSRLVRPAVCVCLAGLIGTQGHWDLLALAAGALAVPARRWRPALWPLTTGLLAGVCVVASASGRVPGWLAGLGLVVAVGAATYTRRGETVGVEESGVEGDTADDAGLENEEAGARRFPRVGRVAAVVACVAVLCCAAFVTVRNPFGHSPRQPADQSQTLAWSAGTDAWRTAAVNGVGPAKITTSHDPVDTYPGFAPDTYVTVVADGGLVGILLVVAAGAVVAGSFRRRDLVSSCAAGAALAFAVAGGVDFAWQLPGLALLGGCVAGLASGPGTAGAPPAAGTPVRRRRVRGWLKGAGTLWVVGVVIAVTTQLLVGAGHHAGAVSRVQNAPPPASATPEAPGRDILTGPDDATDPDMLEIGRRYYLYTSEGLTLMNVPLRIGSKLGHWTAPIDVLPKLPSWATGGLTWAPEVHKVAGGWALYFTALLRDVNPYTHCIGSAFARSPRGPFVPSPHPFICQLDHRGSIDARVYVESDNQLVMLWKSDDNANPSYPGPDQNGDTGIYAQALSANGRVLLGDPVKIFSPTQPWEGTIVEAPDMIEAWGTYWLFFSGNWYDSTSYGIGVAECQSPFGPCADNYPQPFLGSNRQGVGPGEESLFADGNDVYLLYNPFKANDPGPVIPRPVAMTRLGFSPEGPYLAAP